MELKNSTPEYKENSDFKEKDFLLLFMNCLKQHGRNDFIIEEIIDRLYPYKYDEKYQELFNDIFPSTYDHGLDLWRSIAFIKTNAYVNWSAHDPNRLIIAMPDNWYKYIEYSSKYIELMHHLVDEYLLRSEFEKKGNFELNIYGLEPNKGYILTNGVYKEGKIEKSIITDGILTSNESIYRKAEDKVYIDNPRDEMTGITLNETKSRYITVKNASFVIEQIKMGYSFNKAKLFTKILDSKILEILTDYSTRCYSSEIDEVLTSEKPHVFSLKNI